MLLAMFFSVHRPGSLTLFVKLEKRGFPRNLFFSSLLNVIVNNANFSSASFTMLGVFYSKSPYACCFSTLTMTSIGVGSF